MRRAATAAGSRGDSRRARPAAPAAAPARSARSRASSSSSAAARPAAAAARRSPIRARPATARAARSSAASLSVKIPAGVDEGTRIRVSGEGEAGVRGAASGDLYIFVHMKRHAIFAREGTTLIAECPVSFTTAALGGAISLPGLDGEQDRASRSPPASSRASSLRQRGAGMSVLNGRGRGDLVARILVETPTRMSAKQKKLLEEFRETETGDECPATKSFFQRDPRDVRRLDAQLELGSSIAEHLREQFGRRVQLERRAARRCDCRTGNGRAARRRERSGTSKRRADASRRAARSQLLRRRGDAAARGRSPVVGLRGNSGTGSRGSVGDDRRQVAGDSTARQACRGCCRRLSAASRQRDADRSRSARASAARRRPACAVPARRR